MGEVPAAHNVAFIVSGRSVLGRHTEVIGDCPSTDSHWTPSATAEGEVTRDWQRHCGP